MIYRESDLFKCHQLAQRGFNFNECLDMIRIDKIGTTDTDRLDVLFNVVSEHYELTREQLAGSTRKGHVVEGRRMFLYLARILTNKSLSVIGARVNKDHATVLHQFRKGVSYFEIKDEQFLSDYDTVTKEYHKRLKLVKKQKLECIV